jgi:2-hydroxychromene-2-carboxylate isomerase
MNNGSRIALVGVSFAAGMATMWALDRTPDSSAAKVVAERPIPTGTTRAVNPGAVVVELFVMSQCPYGVQAEAAFAEPMAKLGADLDLRVEYIGDVLPGGGLGSMHGAKEVRGDMVQVCAMKHSAAWFEFITCQNEDWKNVDTNWEACASKLGIAKDAIAACADGEEGKKLLGDSFDRASKKGVSGSPTIFIGGKPYEGSRRASDLMRAICAADEGEKPQACSEIPELPKVNVTLIGDVRCGKDCDLAQLEGNVRGAVGNPIITRVDASSAEGKKLRKELGKELGDIRVPAVVFDATLDADPESKEQIPKNLKQAGDYKFLSLGDWNPTCADDGGCKEAACKDTIQCRPEEPKKLEVFVMSQCPYGVKGLDAMKPVLASLDAHKESIDFQIHFIGDGDAGSLTSMHGQPEVDEDLREICALAHGKGRQGLDYIWCRNPDIRSNAWQTCAGEKSGIAEDAIEKCSTGDEGQKLLAASFAKAKSLGIGGSPTWLVNGKFQFSGIDPQTIMTNLCKHNKLAACSDQLAGAPAAAPGAPEPGCSE